MTVILIDASADMELFGTQSKSLKTDYPCKFKGPFILYIYFNLNPYLYNILRTMECQVFIDVNCFDIENDNNTENKVRIVGVDAYYLIITSSQSRSSNSV